MQDISGKGHLMDLKNRKNKLCLAVMTRLLYNGIQKLDPLLEHLTIEYQMG